MNIREASRGPTLMCGSTRFTWRRLPTLSLIGWPPSTPPVPRTIERMSRRLDGQLTDLDARFHAGLASCERTEFITTHAAFGYLAERYGLSQIGISGLSPDEEASPARIAEIQQEAAAHGITTIFFETLVSPAVAEAVASDLGLVTDVLDPIEGITADSRGSDYFTVMAANLAALRKANGCS